MRHILDLIARICESGPRASLRGSADGALAVLATQFGSLTAVLFEPDGTRAEAVRVTSGANIPTDWQGCSVPLSKVPFVKDALEAPERVIVTLSGGIEVACGAVSSGSAALHAIALIGHSPIDINSRAEAIDVVRRMLAWTLLSASCALNRALEQRVADRTDRLTEMNRTLLLEVGRRRAAEESLRDSKAELEALSHRLVTAQEEERKRISQDLHDSVSQEMSAVKYSLERATLLIQRNDAHAATQVLETAVVRTKEVIEEVRAIAMNLRPCALDHLGVVSAIRSLYRRWSGVYASIAVIEDINVADHDIPHNIATHLYRAVQEILSNVARHAQARQVLISVRIEDGNLVVSIQDDGVGFQLDACERSNGQIAFGLLGLRARTEHSGGACKVTTALGKGTTVRLQWPLTAHTAGRNARLRLN